MLKPTYDLLFDRWVKTGLYSKKAYDVLRCCQFPQQISGVCVDYDGEVCVAVSQKAHGGDIPSDELIFLIRNSTIFTFNKLSFKSSRERLNDGCDHKIDYDKAKDGDLVITVHQVQDSANGLTESVRFRLKDLTAISDALNGVRDESTKEIVGKRNSNALQSYAYKTVQDEIRSLFLKSKETYKNAWPKAEEDYCAYRRLREVREAFRIALRDIFSKMPDKIDHALEEHLLKIYNYWLTVS